MKKFLCRDNLQDWTLRQSNQGVAAVQKETPGSVAQRIVYIIFPPELVDNRQTDIQIDLQE